MILLGFIVWRAHLHFQVSRQLGAIRAAGLLSSPKELDAWYAPLPESRNATKAAEDFVTWRNENATLLGKFMLTLTEDTVSSNANTSARTAIGMERFVAKRGRLPETLDELTPESLSAVLTDPFDGEPLRYRKLEKGYAIYSVDKDGADDGGCERPSNRWPTDTTTYDMTFVVEQ
ncbi:MAG: hypothetical protein NZ739_01560 [Verrucomicrobiae bacterium]|nr:hypothetical protein [Verrucomicrobiae bacterium]MDW7979789.1 hypothetical protein [Verrucomicrobiales bacterium]